MNFSELGLNSKILRALEDQGYETPTPIQAEAIPLILSGADVMASAQTGTGKTAGFTLPMLERLSATKGGRGPRALVLAPTRELANQVSESVTTYSKHLPIRSTVVYGGVSIQYQTRTLRRGVDIIVATPGRLLDHVSQGNIDLSHVEIVVLDEADRMLDMGFINDIKRIGDYLPQKRQTLMFSATFSKPIEALANTLMHKPERVQVSRRNEVASQVSQVVHLVKREQKLSLLIELIHAEAWPGVLVFSRTKMGAEKLAQKLDREGISSEAIHGDKSQRARMHALSKFKRGQVQVLVGTDVAARGLDIDKLECVVNFDMPEVAEDYVHRIGRTGRAGESGTACSLVSPGEMKKLSAVEKLIGKKIDRAGPVEISKREPVKPRVRDNGEDGDQPAPFSTGNPFSGPDDDDNSPSERRRSSRSNDDRSFDSRGNRPARQGQSRFQNDRPFGGRGKPGRFQDDRPFGSRGKPGRFQDDRPFGGRDKPARFQDDRPFGGRDKPNRFQDDRPFGGRDKPARFQDDRPFGGRDKPARFQDDRPFGGRDKPARFQDDRPFGGRGKGKPAFGKPRSNSGGGQPRAPFHYGNKKVSGKR